MKILKIFGIVVGIHAVALLMIFANPGCSSTGNPPPAPVETTAKPDPAPAISLPGAAPAPDSAGAMAPAPAPSSSDAPVIVFSPTRPGTLAASALEAQPVPDVTPVTTYVVGKGDSLWSIAKKNKIKVSALAHANGISSGSPLHLGQKLVIPGATPAGSAPTRAPEASYSAPAQVEAPMAAGGSSKYRVKSGETLGAIARKLRVRVGDLAAANNISDPQKIRVGQELVVPARKTGSSQATRETGASTPPAAAAVAAAPAAPPPADSDLDAGLKPAAAGQIPTIKLDDSASSGASKPQ